MIRAHDRGSQFLPGIRFFSGYHLKNPGEDRHLKRTMVQQNGWKSIKCRNSRSESGTPDKMTCFPDRTRKGWAAPNMLFLTRVQVASILCLLCFANQLFLFSFRWSLHLQGNLKHTISLLPTWTRTGRSPNEVTLTQKHGNPATTPQTHTQREPPELHPKKQNVGCLCPRTPYMRAFDPVWGLS